MKESLCCAVRLLVLVLSSHSQLAGPLAIRCGSPRNSTKPASSLFSPDYPSGLFVSVLPYWSSESNWEEGGAEMAVRKKRWTELTHPMSIESADEGNKTASWPFSRPLPSLAKAR